MTEQHTKPSASEDPKLALSQRDAALRFLTHDLRAPQSSILTLLELHRINPDAMPLQELLARVEGKARETLALADAFVHYAHAATREFQFEATDLAQVLSLAADEVWPQARDAKVRLSVLRAPQAAPCRGEADSLQRAIAHLLSYAVRWAAAGTDVLCLLEQTDRGAWAVDVADPGPEAVRTRVKQRSAGIDLRLACATALAERHGGGLVAMDSPELGPAYRFLVPAAPAADLSPQAAP